MTDYNFELLKKENPKLYESIDLNIAQILKKYNTRIYKLFTAYLASDKKNVYFGDKIYKYLYDLYLDSLTIEDLKELKFLNKQINKLKKRIEFEFLAAFTETAIMDIPPMQKSELITDNANKMVLRDNDGFYSTNKHIQHKIDNEELVFKTMNSYLSNKEQIMNGERYINSKMLNRKEVLYIANYLGYGSVRNIILENQTRNKEKKFTKTKEM